MAKGKCICNIYQYTSKILVSSSVESYAETQDSAMVSAIRRWDNPKFWNNSSLRLNEVDDKIYQYQNRLYEGIDSYFSRRNQYPY